MHVNFCRLLSGAILLLFTLFLCLFACLLVCLLVNSLLAYLYKRLFYFLDNNIA
jgi:hypothetical protein